MAAPLPSGVPSASMSRSKTSRDSVRASADEMLRASLNGGVMPPASPASISRSAMRGSARPDAEAMGSTALPGSSSSASMSRSAMRDSARAGAETVGLTTTPGSGSSASVSRAPRGRDTKTPADEMLRLSLSNARGIPPAASESIYSDRPPSYRSKYPATNVKGFASSESGSVVDSVKLRKLQLQKDLDRANAAALRRSTTGLFKAACSTDLLFLIDTTSSMTPYIEAAKQQVRSIVADIKEAFLNESQVRIAVVSYKDHSDNPHIEFLDFTTSADEVSRFLDSIYAAGGADPAEDVLGGLRQSLQANWKLQTRCLIHIADAPPHGSSLHDLGSGSDYYYNTGSEPHGLTHEPLLRRLVQLKINYVMLRIAQWTDRMSLVFSGIYGYENAKLFSANTYQDHVNSEKGRSSAWGASSKQLAAEPQFEEMQLGTSYSELRHLVVKSVTTSVSRTAGRLTMSLSRERKPTKDRMASSALSAIREDETSTKRDSPSRIKVELEKTPPKWDAPGWLDERFEMGGFCPAVIVHHANTLGDMMHADENIKLSVVDLIVYARSKPFDQGAMRRASYARTAASTNRFVIKSFLTEGHGQADVAEDMHMQALCKAFALEFNGLLKVEPPLDFLVTSCLQPKSATGDDCLSLEPFIDGKYVKYNNNGGWVNEELAGDRFNQIAQAFSHFTFERSWGALLVNDLQGVGHLLTDPSVQTRDEDRFKLNDTNMGTEGFKFFFATHNCNTFCEKLGLKSNKAMFITEEWEYRERWPTMDPTVCCSNKFCRNIIHLSSAHTSAKFVDHHWCDMCWPQLEAYTVKELCDEPGSTHEFEVSRFFHESQGQIAPRKCPDHREKDTTGSSAAAVGGGWFSKMKAKATGGSISGKMR